MNKCLDIKRLVYLEPQKKMDFLLFKEIDVAYKITHSASGTIFLKMYDGLKTVRTAIINDLDIH